MSDGFDKFTEHARMALRYAQEEAQLLKHNYVGTEHILLGLIRDSDSTAGHVLKELSIDLTKTRSKVKSTFKRGGQETTGEVGLTPRAKHVIELAVYEAKRRNHNVIGTEHLLLGLIKEDEGMAVTILEKLNVPLEEVRTRVEEAAREATIRRIFEQGHSAGWWGIGGLTVQERKIIEMRYGLAGKQRSTVEEVAKALGIMVLRVQELEMSILRKLSRGTSSFRKFIEQLQLREQLPVGQLPLNGPTKQSAEWKQSGSRFDNFTEGARKVLELAQQEAHWFNHDYIGTEHLLLGLMREGDGVAARVLTNLGVESRKVRHAVEFLIGRGDSILRKDLGLTPSAKRVIELAVDEARRLNHHYIGTEHLLLGLVREGEGIAAGVLENMGVSLEKVRSQVIEVLKSSGGSD